MGRRAARCRALKRWAAFARNLRSYLCSKCSAVRHAQPLPRSPDWNPQRRRRLPCSHALSRRPAGPALRIGKCIIDLACHVLDVIEAIETSSESGTNVTMTTEVWLPVGTRRNG